jgi:hypothetical protein
MNSHYINVLEAFLLAQLLITSIMVYLHQKEKSIKYGMALATYMKAEIGYFIVGVIGILCVIFLLSDFIDLAVTKEDLKSIKARNWKQNLQLYFKTGSFIISSFIQYIAFKYREKGKVAIDKAADKIVSP